MKKKSLAAIFLACALSVCSVSAAGCGLFNKPSTPEPPGVTEPGAVAVTGVELSLHSATISVGGVVTLTATVSPSNATNKNVTWKSSNESVATVSGGVVTGRAAGTATITVTTADGGKTDTFALTVNAAPLADCTVRFYSDDALVDTQTVKANSTVTAPEGLQKPGYILSGWAIGSATGTAFDLNTPVTSNMSLYAVWTEITADSGLTYENAGNESAAFEWGDNNAAGAKVEYKLSTSSAYTTVDSELIRATAANVARVDVVGLKGGATYDFKITTSAGKTILAQKEIGTYDRSGYAHFNYTSGVGAYNDDGTLKSNAKIIYLTEENKNNIDGNGTSIAEYLSSFKNKTNTTPIIIRVVGTVGSATWNLKTYDGYSKDNPLSAADFVRLTPGNGSLTLTTNSKTSYTQQELIDGGFNTLNTKPAAYNGATCEAIDGLNSKISCASDTDLGWVYDSCWNDCLVENVNNVTVEGIGEDAEIFQWGFTFKNSTSIEVRNLHFDDYTEDGCSFEGSETSATSLSGFKSGTVWLHHNTFDEGMNYWDVCDEQDKGDGDGSTDFKGIKNITIAYNHYIQTHKTNLIGGGDTHATANVTFHHNYYESCNQRMPLGRQANMHMYNNYYSGSTLYSISLRAGAYAFIENCYFTEDASNHYPVELNSGSYGAPAAKIINCVIDESKVTAHNAVGSKYLYIGTDRNATVDTSGQRFAPNFDTNSTLFYYANGQSKVAKMHTAEETKTIVPRLAGVQKRGGLPDDIGDGTETPDTPDVPDTPDPTPGSEVDMATIYSQLLAQGNKIYSNDFSSGEGTKLAQLGNAAGVYSKSANEATDYTEIKNGQAVQVSNENPDNENKKANTVTAISFGSVSKTVEGYFEMSVSAVGSKWDLISFVNASGKVFTLRIDTSSSDPLTYYTTDSSSTTTPSKSLVWAANKTYKVYYKVDLTTGKITVIIEQAEDSSKRFEVNGLSASITSLSSIQLSSSSSGARLVTLDNVVFCGE